MYRFVRKYLQKRRKKKDIAFDEVLLDALNIASVDTARNEGRIELPISVRSIYAVFGIFLCIAGLFSYRLVSLQIINGDEYAARSEENTLRGEVIIAERGVVYDRFGELLAWNDSNEGTDIPLRRYTDRGGLGAVLGYTTGPRRDDKGVFYTTEYTGVAGVEAAYGDVLEGTNGRRLTEFDAQGDVLSSYAVQSPRSGGAVTLSIDAELSEAMHKIVATSTERLGFQTGVGVIMDVTNGEIVALSSYPAYDPNVLADGVDREKIAAYNADERFPLLNKAIGGRYIPGSVVKPFIAYSALAEGVVSPEREIFSSGQLVVPNPYHPENPSIFGDWKAHGYTDMREAIKVSGDVYFYTIGGGHEDIEGLGITKLHDHMQEFGFTDMTGIGLPGEIKGVVPNPEWKEKVFNEPWRLGDTYLSSIGQFGWQITPISLVRAYAVIANGGKLLTPTVKKDARTKSEEYNLDENHLRVVREGMRMAVDEDGGTVRGLDLDFVSIAAKSGTAELDAAKTKVHTWVAGYFPYEEPRYSFMLMLGEGPYDNTVGASWIMRDVFMWMKENRPDMLGDDIKTDED